MSAVPWQLSLALSLSELHACDPLNQTDHNCFSVLYAYFNPWAVSYSLWWLYHLNVVSSNASFPGIFRWWSKETWNLHFHILFFIFWIGKFFLRSSIVVVNDTNSCSSWNWPHLLVFLFLRNNDCKEDDGRSTDLDHKIIALISRMMSKD